MKKFICPLCRADLKEYLMYVDDGCTNYIFYKFIAEKKVWQVFNELDGNNAAETYFACRECDEKLPEDMQKYFSEKTE